MQADADPQLTVPLVARALWGDSIDVSPLSGGELLAQRAVLTRPMPGRGGDRWVLHLPPPEAGSASDQALAVACHAAAHRQFGGPPQPRAGLKPIQQVLLGVLEDARVEWLALQELPGLRAVWRPFHGGDAASRGNGFEDLLARLSASLLDPDQPEPHPWVARVRQLFFEADGHTLALRTAQAVREAASTLGHDIGQMRLPFNARTYRVHAAYRDDNSHLWLPDDSLPTSDVSLTLDAEPPREEGGAAQTVDELPAPLEPDAVHAEWDHRIGRYRADWCSVFSSPPDPRPATATASAWHGDARRLAHQLAALRGRLQRAGGRDHSGDHLHAAALVEAGVDQRLGRTPDGRIHQRQQRLPTPLAVLLLVDASRSTAGPGWAGARSVLHDMQASTLTTAHALQSLGHRTAVSAFSSHGRHRVFMPSLKAWGEPVKGRALPPLPSEGSTRLGAVLRHGLHLCRTDAQQHPGWRRVILLVTDGELHDVDVHDPAYLGADLQRALVEAARQGVGVGSLLWTGATLRTTDPAFDHASRQRVQHPRGFAQGVVALLRALL
ncbi:MAG: nitric oxide reductase activation protein NorD [Hydrogenophaga sp.]